MNWLNKLLQLESGANSRIGARREQTKWSRKTTRSVEITVERQEVTLYQTTSRVVSGRKADSAQSSAESGAETDED